MTAPDPSVPIETLLTHRAWVDALARRLVADENAADDVAQQTWLAALRNPPADETTARSWLGRVARNFARERHREDVRRERRENAAARPEIPRDSVDIASVVARAELHKRLVLAVMDLEEPYRATVLLRFFEGLPPREVALRMDVPVETVRTRTRRAVEQLRERMDRDHGGNRCAWAMWIGGAGNGLAAKPLRTGTAAAAAGGFIVGKKLVAAAVALALLVWGAWHVTRDETPRSVKDTQTAAPDATVAPPRHAAVVEPQPEPPPPAAVKDRPFLAGRVIDAGGRGIAGASVVVAPELGSEGRPAGTLPSATSGADGAFRVDLTEEAALWTAFADAPGHGLGRSAARRPGEDATIVLSEAKSLNGRVLDPDGRPVAGATVRWITTLGSARIVRSAATGADGTFRVERIPLVQYAFEESCLAVDAAGFATLTTMQPSDPSAFLDLKLSRGCVVIGRVVDAGSGAAMPGVRVLLWTYGRPDVAGVGIVPRTGRSSPAAETLSDPDGRYRFEHLPVSDANTARQAPGGTKGPLMGGVAGLIEGSAPADDEVPIARDGEVVETELRMWAAATVEGRVVDAAGHPMQDFGVSDWAEGRRRGWLPALPGVPPSSARTGADGRYRLENVPVPRTGTVQTLVRAGPRDSRLAMGFNGPSADVTVKAGETTQAPDLVTSEAPASAWIEVTDDEGRPVWGASASFDQWMKEATTRADGRMQFWFTYNRAGIPPKAVTVIVRAPGLAAAATPEFVPSVTDPPTVRVRLARGVRMKGRVVDTAGKAIGGASVTAIDANIPLERAYVAGWPIGAGTPIPADLPRVVFVGSATSASDGTFEFDCLPAGAVHLHTSGPPGEAQALAVPSNATDAVLTVRAKAEPERGDATVEVVDADTDELLRGASAMLFRSSGSVNGTDAADAPGVVPFKSVVGGTWEVRVKHDGHVTKDARLTVSPKEPVTLRVPLKRGATVRGRVIVPPGNTVDAAYAGLRSVDANASAAAQFASTLGSAGAFEFRGVPDGRWLVVVYRGPGSHGYLVNEENVEIETRAGGEYTTDVRACVAQPAGFVVGERATITSISATPSAAGTFVVRDATGRTRVQGSVMGIGMSHSITLPEGRYVLTVTLDGAEPVERAFDVVAGKYEETKVPLPAAKTDD